MLVLFDVDGTLTKSRQDIEDETHATLKRLKQKVTVGLVGGSDMKKISGTFSVLDLRLATICDSKSLKFKRRNPECFKLNESRSP